jgi:flagellar motor switch protein FliN
MSNGFLSQEEIDSLLNGGSTSSEPETKEEILTDVDKDLLGEIGNISMGSASTALSTIINQPVNITTPVVSITTLSELKESFHTPNIALEVQYTSGIVGENILVMRIEDASIIASLMMGGDGSNVVKELSEIEISAVSEAMNQMIGSSATSMATMFGRKINISPPKSKIWEDSSRSLSDEIKDNDYIVEISFHLTIGSVVDSSIMQVLPIPTARKIVSIMMGQEPPEEKPTVEKPKEEVKMEVQTSPKQNSTNNAVIVEKEAQIPKSSVEVQKANFQPLQDNSIHGRPRNMDLIMDVPLEISVVLGRTKKNIKDILNFGTGSLIELDKLAEEPVEILVNGKRVAFGEVVVVDENFGVRITNIVSSMERVKSLGD